MSSSLLALVVFSLSVSIVLASPKDCPDGLGYFISMKAALPTNSDNQLPYEERETEKDDELQDNFPVACIFSEAIFFTQLFCIEKSGYKTYHSIDSISEVPLYLSKRVLLI